MRTVRIPLNSRKYPGLYALIDESDIDLANQYQWHPSKGQSGAFYARASPSHFTSMIMHRLILDANPGEFVDHINRDTLDNRRENLRIVTKSQNNINRAPWRKKSSIYKGVSWETRRECWRACIDVHGRTMHLGCFTDAESAANAYDVAALATFGEYACTNNSLGILHPGDLNDETEDG